MWRGIEKISGLWYNYTVIEQIDTGFVRKTAMKIIDTYTSILTVYNNTEFSFNRWKKYIDSVLPGLLPTIVRDTKRTLCSGDISRKDLLSVLNLVARSQRQAKAAHNSFLQATEILESVIYERFGKNLDVSIVFYLGLCNGAGWVTDYREKTAILLGIEKIIELDWCNIDDMYGLIYHELGHVYQKKYGILKRTFDNDEDSFLWRIFTEGVAMCFEQNLIGDTEYYHQDKNGWKTWCDNHFEQIKLDFEHDMKTMSVSNQRYFGDWVSYNGHGDVGYYLGCRFVRYILSMYEFDEIICFDINNVKELFEQFKR